MTELLAIPLKRGSDVDLSRPLTRWISSTFSSADRPEDASSSINEINKMRQSCARLSERGEVGLNSFSNYYDQLVGLQGKVPANELQIPFKWKDAFDRGGIFGSRVSLAISSITYEKICVLFNIAAFNSGVAVDQNLESGEGLQKALKRLQAAAGIFTHLKETVVGAIQQDPTPDLEPETLSVLADLMLAQAQEMVALKAIGDKMKDAIVAKLCAQCDDMFANLMRSMQRECFKSLWDSDWIPNISGKQAIYNGLAQYHQARVCNASKAVGEEIARLEYAKILFTAGIERGTPGLCSAKEWLKKTERDLAAAKKDNDFIYHERIPDEKSLTPVSKAAVAKPTPVPDRLGNPSTKMLFDSLVPVPVHQAMAAYDVRKMEIVNNEVGKLKEATTLMNELLSSMNLPAALEVTSGNDLPQSLKDKAESVKNSGGTQSLNKLISELPELLTRNTEILDECERLLKEEKDSDDQLRNQFKDKWKRTPSDQLTSTFNANAQKYRTIINNAKQADKVVRDKFDAHKIHMDDLSGGSANVKNSVPDPNAAATSGQGLPVAQKLREQMEQVETIRAERQVVESELKSTNPDMKNVFLDSFRKEGSVSGATISMESLNRAFSGLQRQVADSIKAQEELMDAIQKNHEIFSQQSGMGSANARDEKLKQLAAAHDVYFELKGNLQEGTKFYNDLTQLLVTFQSKVNDFCFARKTEKEELMKDLTSSMSGMSINTPAPHPPAHHQASATDSSGAKTAPPRPPPPTVTPTTSASAPTATAPAPNPYSGAPAAANPYAGAPAGYNLPYPVQPNMPVPPAGYPQQPQYATQMPGGYNPYASTQPPQQFYPGYPQQPGAVPPNPGYPQQPGATPYPAYPQQYQQPPAGYPPQQWGPR